MQNRFYGAFDIERESGKSDERDFRTPFQVDRDRVLHTPAFRRMQSKTQVFWSGEYDFYRTRLTHSLEVAQIGKSICRWLKHSSDLLSDDFYVDEDLIEAVCLSHDLGHPPFGHAGERSLNHFMADYGGFEGNAQTLRLLTDRIFSQSRTGMDPTRSFMDGVLKYKSLWSELKTSKGKLPGNHFLYDHQVGRLTWAMGEQDFPAELVPGDVRDSFKSIECQIMDWADDTAYSLNDLADSVRAGFLTVEKVERWAEKKGVDFGEESPMGKLILAIRGGRIEPFVGKRIGKFIRSAHLESDATFLSAMSHRYSFKVVVDEDVRAESELFKSLAYEVVFLSPQLKQLEHKGSLMLRRLWELLDKRYVKGESIDGQNFQLLGEEDAAEIEAAPTSEAKARLICDFLAGMTDGFAVRMYRRLFEPGFGSIGDLVG
ncbi:dNTP triphosphohydrolase [Akkermansiaceae bacterium]|nr:dNTP triphosphohydrolase [Akkermansiaceae bacterium]